MDGRYRLVGDGAAAADVLDAITAGCLSLDKVALLKDLDDSILLLGGAELSLEDALGGRVKSALVAVLVGDKDLEAVDDLSERHALVLLPVLNGLDALDEDNEVLAGALVVALGLGGVSAHVGCVGGG